MSDPRRPFDSEPPTGPDVPGARRRQLSEHDIEEAAARGAERGAERAIETGRHRAIQLTSTPPAIAWLESRAGRFFFRKLLPAALLAAAAGAGGWVWRDCQAQIEAHGTRH